MLVQKHFLRAPFILVCLAIAWVSTTSLAAVAAGNRFALIIANSDYVNTKKLPNPANDGTLIADKLRELGFDVQFEKNLDAHQISDVVKKFATGLNKDSEALFYYAGHGLQYGGENFLVGVDAQLNSEATLQFETFRLNTVINLLEAHAGTTLLFWDACRNNPLADALVRTAVAAARDLPSAVRGGAAPIAPSRGDTLVVFSAEPGKLALDGAGDNSPFAAALGARIGSPNIEVESMLKQVAYDVFQATKGYQRPERLSQLMRDFFFKRSDEQIAEEQEVSRLRAKLAMLEEQRDSPRQRFRIMSINDPALSRAKQIATRDATPESETQSSAQASSVRAANTGSITSEVANKGGPEIVIAVDSAAATIVRKLAISPDGKLLALGDDDGLVRIILLKTFEVIRTISAHSARITDIGFAPDSRTLLSAGLDGKLRYWDVETGKSIRELSVPAAIPYSARINSTNPDRWVLMGDNAGRLIAWDLKENKVIMSQKFHNGSVLSVDYQPGGKGTYLSGAADGELKIRLDSGKRQNVRAHSGRIFVSRYSSTGKLIYTGGTDRKVKVWDATKLQSGATEPKYVLEGHLRYVLTADMSPDETTLASGGGDKLINLWNVQSGNLAGQLTGHTADVEAVAFTPNGKFVVSASEDKTVRVWSVRGGTELVRLFFQKKGPKCAGITLDNQSFGDQDSGLLSVYEDGRAVLPDEADRVVPYIGRQIVIVEGN